MRIFVTEKQSKSFTTNLSRSHMQNSYVCAAIKDARLSYQLTGDTYNHFPTWLNYLNIISTV